MDGVITRQSEEYIMMMRMLKKCSKEILEFQGSADFPGWQAFF